MVLERGDGGGQAVVGQRGGDRHHRQAGQARGVLGEIDRAAAADADQGVVEAFAQLPGERCGLLHAPALGVADLGVVELQASGDLLAEAGPDDDGDVAAGGDPAVGQQRGQARDGAGADVDGQRRADHPGQQWHATSRARARSSWSSTSTHATVPIGAVATRPPRSASSWKPSS